MPDEEIIEPEGSPPQIFSAESIEEKTIDVVDSKGKQLLCRGDLLNLLSQGVRGQVTSIQ